MVAGRLMLQYSLSLSLLPSLPPSLTHSHTLVLSVSTHFLFLLIFCIDVLSHYNYLWHSLFCLCYMWWTRSSKKLNKKLRIEVSMSVCQSVGLSVCQSVCLSLPLPLPLSLSLSLSLCLSLFLSPPSSLLSLSHLFTSSYQN